MNNYKKDIEVYKSSRDIFIKNIQSNIEDILDHLKLQINEKEINKIVVLSNTNIDPSYVLSVRINNTSFLVGVFEDIDMLQDIKSVNLKEELQTINEYLYYLNKNFKNHIPIIKETIRYQ